MDGHGLGGFLLLRKIIFSSKSKSTQIKTPERMLAGFFAGQCTVVDHKHKITTSLELLKSLPLFPFSRIRYQKLKSKIDRAYGHDMASIAMLKFML